MSILIIGNHDTKKSVETSVVRSTNRGSCIVQFDRTDNVRAHADMNITIDPFYRWLRSRSNLKFARFPARLKQSVSKRLIMSWTNLTSSRQYLNTCPDKSGDKASLLHYFSHPIPSLYRFVTDDSAILRTAQAASTDAT